MPTTAVAIFESLEPRVLFNSVSSREAVSDQIDTVWTFALSQLTQTLATPPSAKTFPSYTNAAGKWVDVSASDWTSGFFTGELWEAYAHSHSRVIEKAAIRLTSDLTSQTEAKDDLALRFLPTDGLEFQFTGDKSAERVLIAAAASKVSTYDASVGVFRSVDGRGSASGNPLANVDVLIDHTMDIELVYRAASLAHQSNWIRLANQHMEKLETTLVRPDGSTYQWGYFNDKTGDFVDGETRQGYSNSSTWSRGQAWAMYSFTAAAALRGRAVFLATAEKTTNYFIEHLPADGIPYWDFNAPITPATPRDSSAAAIAADALLRLAKLIPGTAEATRYQETAEKILATLMSPSYLAGKSRSDGILRHGALWVAKGDKDQSLSFGDYYFLDAMNRYEGLV